MSRDIDRLCLRSLTFSSDFSLSTRTTDCSRSLDLNLARREASTLVTNGAMKRQRTVELPEPISIVDPDEDDKDEDEVDSELAWSTGREEALSCFFPEDFLRER